MRKKRKCFPGGAQFILHQNYQFPPPVHAYSITWFWSLLVMSFMHYGESVIGELALPLWRGQAENRFF